MSWTSKSDYKWAAMARTRHLKSIEARYRAHRGPNPLLPDWTDKPRSGAKWSDAEEQELLMVARRYLAAGQLLTPWIIAELGWLHGRSADSIDTRLRTILSWKDYNDAVVLQ